MSLQFKVEGKVTQTNGSSSSNIIVRCFDKGLPSLGIRGEKQLGKDAVTDAEGNYEIAFAEEDFSKGESRRDKVRPDLLIRVFDGDTLLGESKIHFHAEPETRIDLTVKIPERSEYEALVLRITPILRGVALGDLTDEDLAFIEGETKIDPEGLKLLRLSGQLARKAGVATEVLYGLGRQGLALDVDKLVGMPDEKLTEAVVKAAKAKTIPAQSGDQTGSFVRQLKRVNDVVYHAKLQLRDDKTNSSLSNYKVQVFDSNSNGKREYLAAGLTDGAGTFTFNYSMPPASSDEKPAHIFLLKVSSSNGAEIPDTTVELKAGDQQIVQVPVAMPAPKVQPAPAVSKVAELSKVSIPKKLQSFLSENNIRTLADIRKAGGLCGLKGLPVEPDHAAAQMLEAHADLSRLSTDVQLNASLIAKGYSSVAAIADAPRATFVAATHETLGDFKAARLHTVARAQTAFLDNILIGAAAAQKTVAGQDPASGDLSLIDQQCTCEDCESAISPAFYLADLLKYATNHIQRDGQNVDLQFLVDTFHQPFDALQTSCEAVNQSVRSVRICTEILRAHLGPRPLSDLQKESALQKVELEYLTKAYTQLLHQIGTSYDEIRLARTDSEENRKALADRLGIELTIPRPAAGDELDRLFLTFPDVVGSAATLDQLRALESQIEQLFGLVDTRKDPLSDGAKFGDDPTNPSITRWNLQGVEWGRNTDQDGNIYVTESLDRFFSVSLYKDPQRSQRVAFGERPTTFGPVKLLPQDFSDLSGVFNIASFETLGNIIILSVIPSFLSWRLKHLRTTWAQEDHPADPYALGALPLIDPDLIGPDNFRSPVPKASANAPDTTAFDLWLTRRGAIDAILNKLQRDRETNVDGLTFILKEVFKDSLSDFDSLLQKLTQGDKETVTAATEAILNLNLTVDSFIRLMDIRSKDAQSQGGPGDPVSPDEWEEVSAILTQVQKSRLFIKWRGEEQQLNIILGMRDFWISLREPAEGSWPPAQLLNAQTPATPLIDPDLQTLKDLPEPVAGAPAIKLWTDRSAQLKTTNATLDSTRQSGGFEAMLKFALGDPLPHDLDQLRKDLASGNQAVVIAAQNAITNDLHMTLDGFAKMMAIRDKDAQNDPGKKPTAAEYTTVEASLTKAWKIRVAYPLWINDEANAFTAEGQTAGDPFIAYWRLRKATLPRWRASAEARRVWQQALQARSARPIIDPDIIDEYDFRDLVPDPKTAYGIWRTRWNEINGRISEITKTPPQTKDDLDKLFQNQDYIGLKTDDLFALDKDRGAGSSIQGRLDQLGLSNAAFNTLLRVSKLVVNGQPILPSEWMDVASILAQSYKEKRFADWRIEEQAAAILLSPDFFQPRPIPIDPLSPTPEPALPAWLATVADRRAWQDTLQSRIDEQNSTIDGMRQAVGGAEAANLKVLRDGLVMAAAAAGGSDLGLAADWVTKRFLIDAEVDASQTTTRVEQAIETLQSLLLSLSEEPFDLSRFELSGGVAAVEAGDGVHLFARGADDALWHTRQIGNDWQEWESLSDAINSDPAACIHNGKLEVFALRYDNAVWRKTLDNGVWSEWEPLGGVGSSAPAAVSWGGDHLEVVVRGSDWAPWHRRFLNGQWGDWESLSLNGAIISSAPTVTSRGVERLDIFARGMDNGVWYLSYENGFTKWVPRGGIFNSGPSAAGKSGPAGLSGLVFVFGQGSDDLMYFDFFSDASETPNWLNLFPLPAGITLAGPPTSSAFEINRINVWIRASDNRLWHGFLLKLTGLRWSGWSVVGPPPLTMNAVGFETDWKWLGSYAKWRAAMLVFLYPENLLLPTLRPSSWQTPKFGALVNTLATGGALTPDAACQAAAAYATYFQDVCQLFVEASCQTLRIIIPQDCSGLGMPFSRYPLFMFARAALTNKLYYSIYDPEASDADFAQSFWIDIPTSAFSYLPNQLLGIVGAVPYRVESGKRYICLFLNTHLGGQQQLTLLKFNLESGVWEAPVTLNSPVSGVSFTAIIQQNDHEADSPLLLLQFTNGAVFEGFLNSEADGWSTREDVGLGGQVLGMVWRTDPSTIGSQRAILQAGDLLTLDWGLVPQPAGLAHAQYHGLMWLPLTPQMRAAATVPLGPVDRAFFAIADGDGIPRVLSNLIGTAFYPGIPDIDLLVPSAGAIDDSKFVRQFVYWRRTGQFAVQAAPVGGLPGGSTQAHFSFPLPTFRCTFQWQPGGLSIATINAVALSGIDPLDIPGRLSSSELQSRREREESTMITNAALPASLLTYLEEAYYFVPMQIALQLERSGEYEAALGWFRTVYDYTAPKGDGRKIYYGLKAEESIQDIYKRPDNWLSDPLNPHAIARTRGDTYTRYTLLCIVRCLLDYADSEFSQDTGESVARARNLYQTALDLLDTDVLKQRIGDCAILSGALNGNTGAGISSGALLVRLKARLANISERDRLRDTVVRIQDILSSDGSPGQRFVQADQLAVQAEAESTPPVMKEVLSESQDLRGQLYLSVARKPGLEAVMQALGEAAGADFTEAMARVTNLTAEQLDSEPALLPWLRVTSKAELNAVDGTGTANLATLQTYQRFQTSFVPSAAALWGCIPPNPMPASLRQHAEVNLRKIRSGRNIAGMVRDLNPYAAPTNAASALPTIGAGGRLNLPGVVSIQPTLYRYAVLIERAKQLTQTAIQMEASMLAALEKFDDRSYSLLRARQDLSVAQATSQLSALKVNEANDGVNLANSQQDRIKDQIAYFDGLLNESDNDTANTYEQEALVDLDSAADLQRQVSSASFPGIAGTLLGGVTGAALGAAAGTAIFPGIGTVIGGIGGAIFGAALGAESSQATSDLAQASFLATSASASLLRASFERRKREWQFQLKQANDDAEIVRQQIAIANDDVNIAKAEQGIAVLQQTNAQDTVEFLTNEFTNPDLYNFMSDVLGQVYSYFLRQASAMAKLAENQVAFERQQAPTGFIQADYWAPPTDMQSGNTGSAPDRKGLTGAERLLEDITKLDQYAFLSDQRKLQLVKTFSLGRLAPAEFQRFRESGVMTFGTPMELFDRDFPGHYLRLISSVRTTVIALIPPNQGISATLSSNGLSRIVIGGDVFQTVPVRRQPESIALSSPMSATGVSELTPQSNTMLLPFEDTGVDTSWEFRMEKASNLFDYSTIADVLVTIVYTALGSPDYRQQVIKSLNPTISADRPYSFRNQFPDQWYDLHNPDQSSTPMTVRFTTFAEDFPPNIDDIRIQQVLLYFSRADGQTFEVSVTSLRFTARDAAGAIGGGATSVDGVISTRRGNAGSWIPMIGKHPFGEWELSLPDTEDLRAHFNNDDIQEILFVITYTGNTPERPS